MAIDKVVDSAVLDGYFSDIADAIRDKDGTQNTYMPAQMPQAIEDIPSGGGIPQELLDLLSGTASGVVTLRDIETLGVGLFFSNDCNSEVTVLNMPDLVNCGGSRYEDADGPGISGSDLNVPTRMQLRAINLPKCKFLRIPHQNGVSTNAKLQSLQTLNAPLLESLTGNLRGAALTSVNFPELSTMLNANFAYCTSLVSVSMPRITDIAGSMFEGCTALRTINFGKLRSIGASAFRGCSQFEGPLDLTSVTVAAWSRYICYGCTNLEQVEFQNTGSLGPYFFQDSGIKAIIVRHKNASGTLSLSDTSALTNTPIASGTGYIYVPRALIATYEAATNWSTYAGQFRALEDYTSDGTVDGDFVPPTA